MSSGRRTGKPSIKRGHIPTSPEGRSHTSAGTLPCRRTSGRGHHPGPACRCGSRHTSSGAGAAGAPPPRMGWALPCIVSGPSRDLISALSFQLSASNPVTFAVHFWSGTPVRSPTPRRCAGNVRGRKELLPSFCRETPSARLSPVGAGGEQPRATARGETDNRNMSPGGATHNPETPVRRPSRARPSARLFRGLRPRLLSERLSGAQGRRRPPTGFGVSRQ